MLKISLTAKMARRASELNGTACADASQLVLQVREEWRFDSQGPNSAPAAIAEALAD